MYQDSSYDDFDFIATHVKEGRHREVVGGLWEELGDLQFAFLKARGLRPNHRLLDVGCGALRAGLRFIQYLNPGNYVGVDSNQSLLDAGFEVELANAGIQERLPRRNLICDGDFRIRDAGKFEFALAQSVFTHLSLNRIRQCLEGISHVMVDGGAFYATFFELPEGSKSATSLLHEMGGIVTYGTQDPYHYKFSDFCFLCSDLPWIPELVGDWGHPRGQRMIKFRFVAEAGLGVHSDSCEEPRVRTVLSPNEILSLAPGSNHYRAYVGPPERFDFMSATQFSLLFATGLRENHRVLDFGCGSLRLGRLLIPYLRESRYFGIDPNAWLIADGIREELGWSCLALKKPRFSHNSDFRCDGFEQEFDFIIAQSIATHCGPDLLDKMFREFALVLGTEGRILLSFCEAQSAPQEQPANGWHYPGCVDYTRDVLFKLSQANGLHCAVLPWFHPGATWFMAARSLSLIPGADQMQHLSGAVIFNPQFAKSWQVGSNAPYGNPLVLTHSSARRQSHSALGRVYLRSNSPVVAGTFQTFEAIYEVGSLGIMPGGFVRLAMRHVCPWSEPQVHTPDAAGYVTARASSGVALQVRLPNPSDVFCATFPWQHIIEITVTEAPLRAGDTLILIYGDRGMGGEGAQVQMFEEHPFSFQYSVDPSGSGLFQELKGELAFNIIGGSAVSLVAIAPADLLEGDQCWLIVRAEDVYGNSAPLYEGDFVVRMEGNNGQQVAAGRFTRENRGLVRVPEIRLPGQGVFRFHVSTADLRAVSNPVQVRASGYSGYRIFWGEIHGHSVVSDGRGTSAQYFDYAENVAGLQVCALTDHDFMISDEAWADSKRVANERNKPGQFVTLHAYEWSGMSEVGGDRNVYFLESDPPIIRSRSYYDYENKQSYHGPDRCANHVEDLFKALLEERDPSRVQIIPHYGGRPANPKFHHPELERIIEVFSEHQRSERWAAQFSDRGYRLGAIAGGDNHIGRPGYGFLRYCPDGDKSGIASGRGLVAILAKDLTRESVFDAIYNRRVYGTTGGRILIEMDVCGAPLGSEIERAGPVVCNVKVFGSGPVSVVQIIQNECITQEYCPADNGAFSEQDYLVSNPDVEQAVKAGVLQSGYGHYLNTGWREDRSRPTVAKQDERCPSDACISCEGIRGDSGSTASIAVRVLQFDGVIARSSPVWVTFV